MTTHHVFAALLVAVSLLVVLVVGILLGRSHTPPSRSIVMPQPSRSPTSKPAPLPTRDRQQAGLQDAAANQALVQLRQVAEGADPYSLPGYLANSLSIAACPYGCNRNPRLMGFAPRTPPVWLPADLLLVASSDPDKIVLRAELSGTKAIADGTGKRVEQPLTGHITVEVSREYGTSWEPIRLQVNPPLVPERSGRKVNTHSPEEVRSP